MCRMRKLIMIFLLLLCCSTTACASGWWNDWREDSYDEPSPDYDDGYEDGYDDGYYDGIHDPFSDEDDKAAEFGYWFLSEEWSEQELHAWAAVFNALQDGRDRYPWARNEIDTPVFISPITGTVYHNENCTRLKNSHYILKLDMLEAQDRGFEACEICK